MPMRSRFTCAETACEMSFDEPAARDSSLLRTTHGLAPTTGKDRAIGTIGISLPARRKVRYSGADVGAE